MKDTRKHRYVVGFSGEGQVAYGTKMDWIELLTINTARRALKALSPAKRAKRVIYELVPIEHD